MRDNAYNYNDYGKDNFVCNCTKVGTFGKFCEYYFMSNSSFEETIEHQFSLKVKHVLGSQYVGKRICYKTLECNFGLLCLDWRNICDGKQQCMDGLDENNCELLEYNECQPNEYRCANGQCIDEEFFLDGDMDCMDLSDEQYKVLPQIHTGFENCAFKPDFNCEERLLPRRDFSCGDGQRLLDNVIVHRGSHYSDRCFSFRDKNFMCEFDKYRPLWTMNNGQCVLYGRLEGNTTDDICLFVIKCALNNGQGLECPCNGQNCKDILIHYGCTINDSYVEYPNGGVFAPYIKTFYRLEKLHLNEQPTSFSFTGSVRCIGFQAYAKEINIRDHDFHDLFADSAWRPFETLFCEVSILPSFVRNSSGPQYHQDCWNHLYKSFKCPVASQCISIYRVADGNIDCIVADDEPFMIQNAFPIPVNCSSIEKHRFRCSINEPSCLLSANMGDSYRHCITNNRDEYSVEMQLKLSNSLCTLKNSPECTLVKNYIEQSSSYISITNSTDTATDQNLLLLSPKSMLFSQYCDTFWDLILGFDETPSLCKEWICPSNYYQCLNGQCIPLDWICDGEWDCSDASDEEGLLSINELSQHNSKIINLNDSKSKCEEEYKIRPFANLCTSLEYPCLLANVTDPFNFTNNRPCINTSKIGDGISDCYGGLDERNIRSCSLQRMLGFDFECQAENPIDAADGGRCIPYIDHCEYRCLNGEDKILCFFLKNNSKIRCDDSPMSSHKMYKDVHCLNGTCIQDARCNGILQCSYGEDEYYCSRSSALFMKYRGYKFRNMNNILQTVNLPTYPEKIHQILTQDQFMWYRKDHDYNDDFLQNSYNLFSTTHQIISNKMSSSLSVMSLVNDKQSYRRTNQHMYFNSNNVNFALLQAEQLLINQSIEPWTCNRGVAVKRRINHSSKSIIECFCPPSYFGQFCEYFSDRITVITHLDGLKNIYKNHQQFLNITIKVLTTFIHNESDIIDHHEIHFTPVLNNLDEKQKFYFLYPRPKLLSRDRLYKIRFEAFELNMNTTIRFLAVWEYSIDFNFLPSYRISKILRFHSQERSSQHICHMNPCQNNGTCYPIMNINDSTTYFCSCTNHSYGKNCEYIDKSTCSICSSNSLCRPHYPLCLCLISRFGPTCHLERKCDMFHNKNPCLNGGSCYVKYDQDALFTDYVCLCQGMYYGDHCQYPSAIINIQYLINDVNIHSTRAFVVQLYNYDIRTLDLILEKQQVYKNQPMYSSIIYAGQLLPILAFLKVYYHEKEAINIKYFILYSRKDETNISLTVNLNINNSCPHTDLLFFSNVSNINISNEIFGEFNTSTIVFKYHNLCQNELFSLVCFHDNDYLCLCDANKRAECFRFNRTIDSCRHCLLNSPCIQGDLNVESDFLCLCPECHFGSICQHNTRLLSFTLDSLFANDLFSNSVSIQNIFITVYILILIIVLLFGLFNNLCCFVTFRRSKPREVGVGNYLLINSITSQASILFLFIKIIYFLLSGKGLIINNTVNMILCKSITYLLSCFTRLCFWLTTLVSIERVYVTIYPSSMWIKKLKITKIIIIFTIMFIFGLQSHELIYYNVVPDPKYTKNGTLCVTQSNKQILVYNQAITIFNYIIPCLINFISSFILILVVARKRANTNREQSYIKMFQLKLQQYKELFIPPVLIILSALPQLIISFSLACTEFVDIPWQRYLVITAYFLSYLPQMISYIIFILPSHLYKTEFDRTALGQKLKKFNKKLKTSISLSR